MRWAIAAAWIAAGLLQAQEIRTVQVATGITAPSDIQNAGDGSGRLFLVQQDGLIRILRDGALVRCTLPGHPRQDKAGRRARTSRSRFPSGVPRKTAFLRRLHGPQRRHHHRPLSSVRQRGCGRRSQPDRAAEDRPALCESQRRADAIRARRIPVHRNGRWRLGRRPAGQRAKPGGPAGKTASDRRRVRLDPHHDSSGQSVRLEGRCARRDLGLRAAQSVALQLRPRHARSVDR